MVSRRDFRLPIASYRVASMSKDGYLLMSSHTTRRSKGFVVTKKSKMSIRPMETLELGFRKDRAPQRCSTSWCKACSTLVVLFQPVCAM